MLNLILLFSNPLSKISDLGIGVLMLLAGVWLLSTTKTKKLTLNTNKKKFVRKVIEWGFANVSYPGLDKKRKSVNVEVLYYKHKRKLGEFVPSRNTIRVYINSHADVTEMVNTALHELAHYYQYLLQPNSFQTNYNKLLAQLSYEKHPMEIEARSMASKYTNACIDDLEKAELINS